MWQYGIDPWNADCIHDMSGGLFSFEKQGAVSKHFSSVSQIADIPDRGQPRPPAPQVIFAAGDRVGGAESSNPGYGNSTQCATAPSPLPLLWARKFSWYYMTLEVKSLVLCPTGTKPVSKSSCPVQTDVTNEVA
jgi:hypothetical protein